MPLYPPRGGRPGHLRQTDEPLVPPAEDEDLAPVQLAEEEPAPPPRPSAVPPPERRPLPPSRPAPPPPARSSALNYINLLLALVAVLLSGGALAWHFLHDPMGEGLERYDLSSPKAALVSIHEMERDGDVVALAELKQVEQGPKLDEKLRTLRVRREVDRNGKRTLFYSFEEHGVTKYETRTFEKDARTGHWKQVKEPATPDTKLDDADAAFEKEKELWRTKGELK
jgi:hypothetical protein